MLKVPYVLRSHDHHHASLFINSQLTNPVPCDGYYCRPVIAVSFALSPIWVYYYFNDQFGINIFSSSIGYILCTANILIAALILRYSPDGAGPMDFFLVVSIAHRDSMLVFLLHQSTHFCLIFIHNSTNKIPMTLYGLVILYHIRSKCPEFSCFTRLHFHQVCHRCNVARCNCR